MIISRFLWQSLLLIYLLGSQFTLLADAYDPSASVIRFQKKMANRGNMESQFKLGLMYESGSGLDMNLSTASNWYKKSAAQNYAPARNRLTYLEVKRYGLRSDHNEWLKALKREAKFHDGEALFLLGQMYSEGTGVNKSLTLSLKLLRKAARGNIPGADAAIIRVEEELNQLQAQYKKEDAINKEKEKKRTALILLAASKTTAPSIVKNKPVQAIKKSTRITFEYKKPTEKTKSITKKTTPKKSKTIKTTTPTASKKTIIPIIIETHPVETDEHPMDSICAGRNRFSRACR